MSIFLSAAMLVILGFLCFTGPNSIIGPRHHHGIEIAASVCAARD
jgi:hypothetical protein